MNGVKARLRHSWLLIGLFAWACQPGDADQTQKPANLIPPDRMAQILTEVHLAESRVSKLGLSSADSSGLVYKRLEGQIYKKLDVDTAAYRQSYIYYAANPTKLEAIYKEVVKNLEHGLTPSKKPAHL